MHLSVMEIYKNFSISHYTFQPLKLCHSFCIFETFTLICFCPPLSSGLHHFPEQSKAEHMLSVVAIKLYSGLTSSYPRTSSTQPWCTEPRTALQGGAVFHLCSYVMLLLCAGGNGNCSSIPFCTSYFPPKSASRGVTN